MSSARSARPATPSRATARLPPLKPRRTLWRILDAGAYGAVMSSTYNARPLAAEVLVDGDRWAMIRARPEIGGVMGRPRPSRTGSGEPERRSPYVLARKRGRSPAPRSGSNSSGPRSGRLVGVIGAYLCLALLDVPALLPPWPRLHPARLRHPGRCHPALARPAPRRPPDRRAWPTAASSARAGCATARSQPSPTSPPLADAGAAGALAGPSGPHRRPDPAGCASAGPGPASPRATGWALRGGLLVALAASPRRSPGPRPGRACCAPSPPPSPAGPAAPGTEVQAWITPPAYTGLPPHLPARRTSRPSARRSART